jgi:oligopeptide/dipeptide ABC transporter ATP-binding protein
MKTGFAEIKSPLLEVRDLKVSSRNLEILKGISLVMNKGEILGLAGESGSGKSTLLKCLICLLAPGLAVTRGSLSFDGIDILNLSPKNMRRLRGSRLTLVSQNAVEALNHNRTIGKHFLETMRSHRKISKKQALSEAAALMASLDLIDPERILASYPFELSGGMNQRVLIALAMIMNPDLMLADEPTSALDAAVQAQVVAEMLKLRERYGAAILIVTHNLGVLAHMAESVGIMYAGRIVEYGRKEAVLETPKHPYTKALIEAIPDLDGNIKATLGNGAPSPGEESPGCAFAPRCHEALDICSLRNPELLTIGQNHQLACHLRNVD